MSRQSNKFIEQVWYDIKLHFGHRQRVIEVLKTCLIHQKLWTKHSISKTQLYLIYLFIY